MKRRSVAGFLGLALVVYAAALLSAPVDNAGQRSGTGGDLPITTSRSDDEEQLQLEPIEVSSNRL